MLVQHGHTPVYVRPASGIRRVISLPPRCSLFLPGRGAAL
ncbi:hypothetical protein AXX16_1675 [Serratia rubidaea]|nr:hypothetical protein AXX16_1675 [Serratia rubidaea]